MSSSPASATPRAKIPWASIWFRPRAAVRELLAGDTWTAAMVLAALSGTASMVDQLLRTRNPATPSAPFLALGILIFGPVMGVVSLWIFSHLLRWTGRWLGGRATREELRGAIACAYIPNIAALLVTLPEWWIFGAGVEQDRAPVFAHDPAAWALFAFFWTAGLLLGVWSLVAACHTIAEVQQFRSGWRGLANIVLLGAIVLGAIVTLGVIVSALHSG